MSVRDGAVRLIFAGWLPQDGLFARSASAGLEISPWHRRGVQSVATHSRDAGRSSRSHLLVFLVRLLWGVGWPELPLAGGAGVKDGCSSIGAIPAGPWEEST